jgi:hypothetical protein
MQDTPEQTVLFPSLFDRRVSVVADDPTTSSDGGALLLRSADARLGLIDALAACIPDGRQQGKVEHSMAELLRQRILGIACGYEDANDAARLVHDPLHALVARGTPEDLLASQPSLSRFENGVETATNHTLALTFMHRILTAKSPWQRKRVRRIMIDFDPTVDPTHGDQQRSLFNAYYKTWCYQSLLGFVRSDHEQEQHLVAATLLPGTEHAVAPTIKELFWLIIMLGTYYPNARLCVRLDAGFASAKMFENLTRLDVDFVVGMPENAVLARCAEPHMVRARALATERGQSARVYAETNYAAQTWEQEYRVIIKAEVVAHEDREHRDNARFVVTNLPQRARHIYTKIYAKRGDIENRIKELKNDLAIDRTSCTSFEANRFRVLMTAAAYALLQQVRRAAHGTSLATAQISRLRLSVIKVAARLVASVRRILVHLPQSFAFRREWNTIARRLGAVFE